MYRYFASLLIILPLLAYGQDKKAAEVTAPPKVDFAPSAIRVGVDLFGLGTTLIKPEKTKYEIQGDIDLHKYFFSLDLGREQTTHSGPQFDYLSSGSYFRAGVDFNLTPYNPDRSTIFLGLRYAAASYKEELQYNVSDTIWQGADPINIDNTGLSARWIELVGGMKVRVMQGMYLGYTARYKMYKRINGSPLLDTYDLPGYGLGWKNTNLDFSFYMYYRLSFRYKPVPVKPKDKKKRGPTPQPVSGGSQRP
jgi:hypothetical protein